MPAVGPRTAYASVGPTTSHDTVDGGALKSETSRGTTIASTLTLKFVLNNPNSDTNNSSCEDRERVPVSGSIPVGGLGDWEPVIDSAPISPIPAHYRSAFTTHQPG